MKSFEYEKTINKKACDLLDKHCHNMPAVLGFLSNEDPANTAEILIAAFKLQENRSDILTNLVEACVLEWEAYKYFCSTFDLNENSVDSLNEYCELKKGRLENGNN